MNRVDEVRYRVLLVGRALYLCTLCGVVFGGITDLALGVAFASDGGLVLVMFIQFACSIGGVVGGASGSVAGLALALSGRRVIGRRNLARLVTGSAATVVPLILAGYLHSEYPGLYSAVWVGVVPAVLAAAVSAALLTPRIVNGSPPPRGAGVLLPTPPVPPVPDVPVPGTPVLAMPVPGTPAPLGDPPLADVPLRRRSIVGRGAGWGFLGGTALGAFSWAVECLESGAWKSLALIGFAAVLGAAVGACLGLAAGLALALGGSQVARPMYRAQLIAGGVVTALVLALLRLSGPGTLWGFPRHLDPGLAVAAALAAVLLTPCIVAGMPEQRNRRGPGGGPG